MKDQVTSIEQSRRLLELGVPAYLPYGLVGVDEHNRITKLGCYLSIGDSFRVYLPDLFAQFCKPYLRPTSDLTKEITHRGETFVPMVKLASILCPGFQWVLNGKGAGCVNSKDSRYTFWFDSNAFFTRIFIPPFSKQLERVVIEPCDQIIAFDKLSEWLFDYRGLIPAGLAVDVNTLSENPYEL